MDLPQVAATTLGSELAPLCDCDFHVVPCDALTAPALVVSLPLDHLTNVLHVFFVGLIDECEALQEFSRRLALVLPIQSVPTYIAFEPTVARAW